MGEGRFRNFVVLVLILACVQFVIVVDETGVALLAPAMAREFSLGASARQILVTPFAIAFVCGLPLAGLAMRTFDPGRVLMPAALFFGIGASSGAVVPTVGWLVFTRVVQGLSAAVVTTSVLACLHVLTRKDPRRLRAFAGFSLMSGSGAVAALIVIGPLADLSWRWCFWAIGITAVIGGLAWGVFAVPRVVGAGVTAPAQDRRRCGIDLETRRSLAAVIGANAVLAATVINTSFLLQQEYGWSAAETGWGFLVLNAAAAIGTVVVARTGSPSAARGALLVGFVFLVLGCVTVAVAARSAGWAVAATIPVGLGVGLVFPLVNHGSLASAQDRSMGRAAQVGAAQQVGLAAGALVAAVHTPAALAGLAAVVAGAVVLGAVVHGAVDRSGPSSVRNREA
ncbi:MFS transporter [Gordonia sp. NPDC003504]